jgi:serine/threonine protein phosphatase PrpC
LDDEESRTQRFILACDGLYDVMSNEDVGRFAARRQRRGDPGGVEVEVIVSPKEAATIIMEECLRNGGYMDDVTIIVFDVTCTIPKSEQHPVKN